MKFTPLQLAMGLSLLVHCGVVSAVYVLRLETAKAQLHLNQGQALEIVVVNEPAAEIPRVPAPAAHPVEIPKPLPLPEIKSADLAVRAVLPPVKNEVREVAAPAVPAETKTVNLVAALPALAEAASSPPEKIGDDIPVNYLLNPKPVYPLEALRRQEEGLVILSVKVDRAGFSSQVQVLQSSKFELLDAAAVQAVSQWRFTPARIGPQAVASQVEVPIHFRLTGS